MKIGSKVKILSCRTGSHGALGQIGILVRKNIKHVFGTVGSVKVKIGKRVWGLGDERDVKLEVVR